MSRDIIIPLYQEAHRACIVDLRNRKRRIKTRFILCFPEAVRVKVVDPSGKRKTLSEVQDVAADGGSVPADNSPDRRLVQLL